MNGFFVFSVGLFDRIDNLMAYVLMLIIIYTASRRWFRVARHHTGHTFFVWIRRAIPFRGKDIYSLSEKEMNRIREQDRATRSPMGSPINFTKGAPV